MDLSPENRALIGSAVRFLIAALLGVLGIKASEAQISEATVAVAGLVVMGLSLWWSRSADKKLGTPSGSGDGTGSGTGNP